MDLIFAIGMPGGWEWIIIGLIVVIFFGANKIPEIFRGFGKGIREFKDASKEIKKEIEKESNSDSGINACYLHYNTNNSQCKSEIVR